MIVEIDLKKRSVRALTVIIVLGSCLLLVSLVMSHFIVGTLIDERADVSRSDLAAAAHRFPDSARLRARLAEAELMQPGGDIEIALTNAQSAVGRIPEDYSLRLLLASIEETRGRRRDALESLRVAAKLAPANTDVHWRLANLLLREGRLADSIAELKRVNEANNELLPASLDLIWQASGGNPAAIEGLIGSEFRQGLALAQFLLAHGRIEEAGMMFKRLSRHDRLAAQESAAFIGTLVNIGQIDRARVLWIDSVGDGDADPAVVWNGSFEQAIFKDFAQFDWNLGRSDFARIAIDPNAARHGSRSLRIDFTGRDTTRLDSEIKQLVLVEPGRRHRLECFVRTEALVTPEGPRIVVTSNDGAWSAWSDAVAPGSADWRPLAVEFVAPQAAAGRKAALYISIKRKPRFSYDDPTKGAVWFDDFSITAL